MEDIEIKTKDGYKLAGTYYQAGSHKAPGLLLLHQLGKDRSSWSEIAKLLRDSGLHILTLDIRGHGESTSYGNARRTWKDFGELDFESIVYDVEASKNWMLLKREIDANTIGLIGASITANITIQVLASDPNWKFGVALSPGLNYHGLKIKQFLSQISKPLLVFAGDSDPSQSSTDLMQIFQNGQTNINFHLFENCSAHGTDIFAIKPNSTKILFDYINKVIHA